MTITCAESDLYVAVIAGRLTVKLGPRYEMGALLPDEAHWQIAAHGHDFCVWEARSSLTTWVPSGFVCCHAG